MYSKHKESAMNLPREFITLMQELLGQDEYDAFEESLGKLPVVSVRLNRRKAAQLPTTLSEGAEPVPWCPDGYYLQGRPSFTLDPLFHAGVYYVQEASSMYLSQALRKYADLACPLVALDLCAAPGGKSTLLLSELSEDSLLVCNEVVRQRAQILRENIIKWGCQNAVVTSNEAADFQAIGTPFDLILCDAPCSGEGMFRKDNQAIQQWSPANVDLCQARQRDIVANIWPCLRADGLFIYSTCTYNRKENEANVAWICEQLGADLLELQRFMPHRTRGEGLFMAILRKHTDAEVLPPKRIKNSKKKEERNRNETAANPHLFPESHKPLLQLLTHHLNVLHYGIELNIPKGKDKVQPSHSLSMYNKLSINDFQNVDIDLETALSYLRCESITLPSDTARGYTLLTYENHPLGFVNNLGSRANNLYPSQWRIRNI